MTIRLRFNLFTALLSLVLAGVFAGPADCQEINLDKMKKLEGLVCYQSLKDPAIWYYLPDQPRLAMKNGKPQFSFMKYSRTQKTGKAGTNTAEGGGIVHFLVTYGAGKDRVAAAQRRLQEIQPDARIEGPIVYRKGSFALITSFGQDQETLVRTVAVGKAPLMEGQKAAVSMALSRQGAQLLWESFKGDTPDISLVFDMEFAGVREPYEATIEADWSRVSKHKRLKAGMKYSWFGADVDMLFQELRQDGAIKITTKGENASMDRIIESANAKLLQVMFDPAPVDDLSRAAAENNSYSSLNQAMKMLKEDSTATSGKKSSLNLNSPGFRQMIGSILDHLITNVYASSETSVSPDTAEAPTLPPLPETKTETSGKLTAEQTAGLNELFSHGQKLYDEKQYQEALDVYQEWEKQHYDLVGKEHAGIVWSIASCQLKLTRYDEAADSFRRSADIVGRESEGGRECLKMANQADKLAMEKNMSTTVTKSESPNPNEQVSDTSASDAYNQARRLDEEARRQGYPRDATKKAIDAYEAYQLGHSPTGARAGEIEGRLRSLKKRLATDELEDTADSDTKASELKKPEETPLAPVPSGTPSSSSTAGNSLAPSVGSTGTSVPLNSTTAKPAAATPKTTALKKAAAAKKPGFSLVASFQMKNIKRSGRMVYQMNHFRSEKQSFTMTENIGSLYSRYGNDSRIFKAVAIDDPVFKQREILVTLDGQDASTFTKYLNFVTVKMTKRHQDGSNTNDEVVITPEAFNASNNSFGLAYGYKGDTDRNLWLDYTYQVIWSFHGGLEIRSEWNRENSPMLALNPPYRYRGLTIEGEGEALQQASVRHAVITVNSRINGKQITTQATIRNQGPAPALHLDIPVDMTGEPQDVSITWFLKGGKKIASSPQKLEGDIIYWDELPEGGKI